MIENLIKTQITDEDARKLGEGVGKLVERWHSTAFGNGDVCQPDYIFLTETSSIPYGFAIKEAWKRIYPTEQRPKFYRIDPVRLGSMSPAWEKPDYTMSVTNNKIIEDYFTKRIRKRGAKIIIFEEEIGSGRSIKLVADFFEMWNRNLNLNSQIVTKYGWCELISCSAESEQLPTDIVVNFYYRKSLHPELKERELIPKITGKYKARTNSNVSKYEKKIRYEIKRGERILPQRLTGFVIHGEEVPYAQQFIRELKDIGKRLR